MFRRAEDDRTVSLHVSDWEGALLKDPRQLFGSKGVNRIQTSVLRPSPEMEEEEPLLEPLPVLKLQLEAMISKAHKEATSTEHEQHGQMYTESIVRVMFMLCKKLGATDPIIKYRAIELLDRFAIAYETTTLSPGMSDLPEEEAEYVFKRQEEQCLLRMCTCILIAYKAHASNTSRTVIDLKGLSNLLAKYHPGNKTYSLDSIKSSECRVFKTLNFRLHFVIPIEIIECLVYLIENSTPVTPKTVLTTSIKILDIMYLHHHSIYDRLKNLWRAGDYHPQRDKFERIKSDVVLRGCAVVLASLFILLPNTYKDCLSSLLQVSHCDKTEMEDLAFILSGFLLN